MPKLKTLKSAAKRFKITKKGKILRWKAGRRHLLSKKARKKKLSLKQKEIVAAVNVKTIKRLLPYGG